jgi:hypothetical protein
MDEAPATTLETLQAEPPKLTDVQKQRKHVDGLRRVSTKFVRRGVRTSLETLQKTFFQLLYELRGALTFMQNKHAEHEELAFILAKQAVGQEFSNEDMEILTEFVDKHTPKEPPKEADAGPGTTPVEGSGSP